MDTTISDFSAESAEWRSKLDGADTVCGHLEGVSHARKASVSAVEDFGVRLSRVLATTRPSG
jgi:hypothetical protein